MYGHSKPIVIGNCRIQTILKALEFLVEKEFETWAWSWCESLGRIFITLDRIYHPLPFLEEKNWDDFTLPAYLFEESEVKRFLCEIERRLIYRNPNLSFLTEATYIAHFGNTVYRNENRIERILFLLSSINSFSFPFKSIRKWLCFLKTRYFKLGLSVLK